MSESFLSAVLGPNGARALAKACEKEPSLTGAVVPRAILAWVQTVGSYRGPVPGGETFFSFSKNEDESYSGVAGIGADVRAFHGSLATVAAYLSSAVGVDPKEAVSLKELDAQRLGKSIDVLVKSQHAKALADWQVIHDDEHTPKMVYAFLDEHGNPPPRDLHLSKATIYGGPDPRPVYRVQDHKATGIYSAVSGLAPTLHHRSYESAPSPWNDFHDDEWGRNYSDRHRFLFAFEKPEHALDWFTAEGLARFRDGGFHLTEVPAKKIIKSLSGRQVIFLPHDSFEKPESRIRLLYDHDDRSFLHPKTGVRHYSQHLEDHIGVPRDPPVYGDHDGRVPEGSPYFLKSDKGAEAPGPAHAPTQPGAPDKAEAPRKQPAIPKPPPAKAPAAKVNKVPPLKLKVPKLPGLSITKSEAATAVCAICGGRQFSNTGGSLSFSGCRCLRPLAKSVTVTNTPFGCNLSFGEEWDKEDILSLARILKSRS